MAVEGAAGERGRRGHRARAASAVLAGLGLLDSIYLTVLKLANATSICSDIGDCETVNTSRYSEIGGIPIALLGAAAYLVIFLLLIYEPSFGENSDYARLAIFGIAFAGTLYSAYLTYLEFAVLRAVCPFCVLSAVLITAICVIGLTRLGGEAGYATNE